jgi:hypothetical protein
MATKTQLTAQSAPAFQDARLERLRFCSGRLFTLRNEGQAGGFRGMD